MNSTNPLNVLIVDDSPEDRAETKAALLNGSSRKFNFYEAELGREALEVCEQIPSPRCLLLDHNLPDMDAMEVMAALRGTGDNPLPFPIIIITGSEGMDLCRTASRNGAMGFIGKEWLTPASLTSVVELSLERWVVMAERQRLFKSLEEAAEIREKLVTDEKNARAEAEAANHLKDEFLATLAHELRNPLSSIVSWAQVLLLMTENGDPTLRKGLQTILNNGLLQAKLIDDLFDINRIMRGKLSLNSQPLDLGRVAEQCVASLTPSAQKKGVFIDFQSHAQATMVLADSAHVHQILGNLISNAIKFTPEGGGVKVIVGATDGCYSIKVQDNGKGIAPEFLPYVFDQFSQGQGDNTQRSGGIGLGLAIVKQLALLNGGDVRAESAGVGSGATFTFEMPVFVPACHSVPASTS